MGDLSQLIPEAGNIRQKVFAVQNLIESMPQEFKRELKVEHNFSLGVYARILYIPADTVLVGKLHKYPQINLLRQGCLSVLVGDKVKKLKAPDVITSPAGVKRIAHVHTDTIWVTIHGTHLTNVDEIERAFVAQDEKEYLDFIKRLT